MSIPNKSKIPLRGIGKLFTHLDAGVRAKLESAFAEAEDLVNYHNESTAGKQDKRVLSSYVSAPVLTLTRNNRGFDVSWPRLNDPHVSFYEVQVSLTSNFAAPSVYKIAETSLAVEGQTETAYVRARGVRWSGETGNWSNTVVYTLSTTGPIAYSKGLDDVYAFYITDASYAYPGPIQHMTITPQRQGGGMLIFGSIGGGATASMLDPAVTVLLNNVPYIEIAKADFNPTTLDGPGNARTGGFGPVFVRHDQFYFAVSTENTATTRTTSGSSSGGGVHTNWTAAEPTVYSVEYSPSPGSNKVCTTKNLLFTGFNFSIPTTDIIQGIKVTYIVPRHLPPYLSGSYLSELRLLDAGVARANKITSSTAWASGPISADYYSYINTFGNFSDTWGEEVTYWTPAKVNASDFGVLLRGKLTVPPSQYQTSTSWLATEWAMITVYHASETSGEVKIQVRLNTPQTVATTDLVACTLNVIEFGEALS